MSTSDPIQFISVYKKYLRDGVNLFLNLMDGAMRGVWAFERQISF